MFNRQEPEQQRNSAVKGACPLLAPKAKGFLRK